MLPGNSAGLLCTAQRGGIRQSQWEVWVGEIQEEAAVVDSLYTLGLPKGQGFVNIGT